MTLGREVEVVQNAALGAALEWKFCRGYSPESGELRGTPLPLLFLVLPLCFTESLRVLTLSTYQSSGLRKFEEKLRKKDGADRVWAITERAIAYRELTRKSLSISIATRLLRLDIETGTAWVVHTKEPVDVPQEAMDMLKAAQRFGAWCGELPMDEVAAILRVAL